MQPVLVPVDHSQFWLCGPDPQFGTPRQPTNGLVAAADPGNAIIYTGISSGRVSVLAQALAAAPATIDLDDWDEVADISLPGLAGELTVTALMDAMPPGLPNLCSAGPGDYRVRVHARGRDISYDLATDQPDETYFVLCWPAPATPDTVHKLTDKTGASFRAASLRRVEE